MKIAIYSAHQFEVPYLEKANVADYELVFISQNLTDATANLAKECDVVALFSSDDARKSCIEKFAKYGIKLITTRSAGFNHINIEAAKKNDILVTNVPEYSPNAIAEHCITLLLSLSRKLIPSYERIRNFNFSLQGLMGSELNKKTIGVMGTGSIGVRLIKILHGFGCNILAYDIHKNSEVASLKGVEYVEKKTLFSTCDAISLNLPLNDETQNIIDTEAIKMMKDGVFIINAGRGKLVDTQAVIEGIKTEKIGGFGMDVYEHEDRFFYEDHSNQVFNDDVFARLLTFKNVIVTAHQAFLTDTALTKIAETTFNNIKAYAQGEPLHNKI